MSAPGWLADFQRDFSRFLTTPLDRSQGRLRSRDDQYPGELVARVIDAPPISPSARLGVYHRQYWYRLLDLLQRSFPVTTRLLGHYHFNEPAALFFAAHPPASRDLDRDADGFPEFFVRWLEAERPADAEYLATGMALDRACRDIFAAPRAPDFVPTPAMARRFAELRLTLSPERAIYRESFPILALRAKIVADPSERPWPRPQRLHQQQAFLIASRDAGISFVRLELREARLYELLCQYPVDGALGLWKAECGSDHEDEDARLTEKWLAKSMRFKVWSSAV